MKIIDFLCDLFEVKNVDDITDSMVEDFINTNFVENSGVRRKKIRHVKYNNMVRIRAVGDEKTCDICKKLDGKVYPRKKALEILRTKTHPNCRCRIEPVK